MDSRTALPAWIIFLLIAIGVAFAVGIALLLTQLDSLQQRSLLPQETVPVVDYEATLLAAEVTVVIIAGDGTATTTSTATVTLTPAAANPTAIGETSVPVLAPTCAAAPVDWTSYVVQDDDTAASLAFRYSISILTLLQANCLENEQLVPGQTILVPMVTPTPSEEVVCGVPEGWVQYTVRTGDSLSSLAERHNIEVLLLMNANCLEETSLEPGRVIFLPPLQPMAPMPPASQPRPPMQRTPTWPPGAHPSPTSSWWPPVPVVTQTNTPASWPTSTATHKPWPSPTASSTSGSIPSSTPQPTATATTNATATERPTEPASVTNTPPATATSLPTHAPPSTATAIATGTLEPPAPTATSDLPYPGKAPSLTATVTATTTGTPSAYP